MSEMAPDAWALLWHIAPLSPQVLVSFKLCRVHWHAGNRRALQAWS